jgi:hypothetical protein
VLRSSLPPDQHHMAHDVRMCPSRQYGFLCTSGLHRDRMVIPSNCLVYAVWLILFVLRLISASVGTIVYYGFQCHPPFGLPFLALCFLTGLAGNIFPLMDWFNKREYKVCSLLMLQYPMALINVQFYRIAFFLCLAFSALGPLAALSVLHSWQAMLKFIGKIIVIRSLAWCLMDFRPCYSVAAVVPNRSCFLCIPVSGTHSARECPAAPRLRRRRYALHLVRLAREVMALLRVTLYLALLYSPRCQPAQSRYLLDERRHTMSTLSLIMYAE